MFSAGWVCWWDFCGLLFLGFGWCGFLVGFTMLGAGRLVWAVVVFPVIFSSGLGG